MQTTKNIIQEEIYTYLLNNCTTISDNEAWRSACEISKMYNNRLQETTKSMSEDLLKLTTKSEQQNKIINDIMVKLKSCTKSIIDEFIIKGFGKYELNKQKTKQVLVPKTQVVEKTVQMLNDLKDLQLDYYSNIFVVQETKYENLLF
jgi:nucleoid DNA-binding protein